MMASEDKYWESQWKIDWLEEYSRHLEEIIDGYEEKALTEA